jgi:hypothetical protein
MKFVKEFGIERSGTIYLAQLINDNIEGCYCFSNGFGWKHGQVIKPEKWLKDSPEATDFHRQVFKDNPDGILAIIIVKDPYHWAESIYKYIGYSPNKAKRHLKDPYKRFNYLYLHWYRELFLKHNQWFTDCLIISYEDLLIDPETTLRAIADKVNCELKDMVIPKKVNLSLEFTQDRKDYYLSKNPLPEEVFKEINDKITDRFFTFYQYERRWI